MSEMASCTNCEEIAADPRQKCRNCKDPVCIQCAVYNEDGELFCPECYAVDGGGFDPEDW